MSQTHPTAPKNAEQSAQIDLEKWSQLVGGQRAVSGKWEKGAQGFLSQQFAEAFLRFALEHAKKCRAQAGRNAAAWQLMDNDKAIVHVALDALHYVLSDMEDGCARNRLAASIGKRAEFTLFLHHPEWGGSAHLRGLRLVNGRDLSMGLLRRRLLDKGFRKASGYHPLTSIERVTLGTLFVEIIAASTGLIRTETETVSYKKKSVRVYFTEPYWKFLAQWKRNLFAFRSSYMPMITPPKDWSGLTDGGYLSCLTACSSVPPERWKHFTRKAHPCVLGALNILQRQCFIRNEPQLSLQKEVWDLGFGVGSLPPRERMEKPVDQEFKEKGLGPTAYWSAHYAWKADRRLNSARTKFIHAQVGWSRLEGWEDLYFVWFMDYRGRMYQRGSHINYLGGEVFRTQLDFAQGGLIRGNEDEFAWALGDAWGIEKDIDKRIEFLRKNDRQIVAAGGEPLNYRPFWEAAKEPWRFVQLATEWAEYSNDEDYKTHCVFQLDQTTSAYGHAACLLRSAWLAEMTNVTGTANHDLYQVVADATMALMAQGDDAPRNHEEYCARWWKEHGVPRKLVKQVVMPVIYRRSHKTMLDAISLYLRDEIQNFLTEDGVRIVDMSAVLAKYIHLACKKVMPGIEVLHRWLVEVAKAQMREGYRPYWVTPNGLGVESYTNWARKEKYELQLSGRTVYVSVSDTENNALNPRRSTPQLSADFIHSQDAAFLQRFVWHWGHTYNHPIVTVHDCVGTTIDKVSLLRTELLDQFSRFYSEDYLTRMQREVEREIGAKLPPPPIEGSLDVSRIGENQFLFT